jgi:hypothetical protein
MNTYLVTNTETWGLREYMELSHPDYEHNILLTRVVTHGEFEITPRNAKEEDKLLNWVAKTDNDFILDDWDYEVVEEFGDSDLDADSEMDYDVVESIGEETNSFWDLYNNAEAEGWNHVGDDELIIVDGKMKITAPEGWEIK